MSLLLFLPILVPLSSAAVVLLVSRPTARRWVGLSGSVLHLVTGLGLFFWVWRDGTQAVQAGGWRAPFGITLVADVFSALMVAVAALMGLLTFVYSVRTVDEQRRSYGFDALLHILLMGVCGAFLTGDLFNLYVWFEVMLISSFVLLALGGERPQLEGAVKYVTLNLISSVLFLSAVGVLYGLLGTLNLADLAVKLRGEVPSGLITSVSMLFLIAFGIKAAVFPLFFWLPASYHTPPLAVTAIFGALLTKVGVYALIRVFTLLFIRDLGFTQELLLWVAGLTMVTGVLGAASQMEVRRLLAFHIISQIGYMVMGLGLLSPLALAGAVFYIVHNILAKTNLFFIAGIANHVKGTYDLGRLGGLYRERPMLSVLFIIAAFALAGLPPFSGFFGKVVLLRAGLELESYAIVATAAVVSLLTLFSMTKVWAEAFWKPQPDGPLPGFETPRRIPLSMLIPCWVLTLLTLALGFGVQGSMRVGERIARELLSIDHYLSAVNGAFR